MFHIFLLCSCLQRFTNPLPWCQLKGISICNMPNCLTSLQLVICKVCKMLCFRHHWQHLYFFSKTGLLFFFPSFELYVNYPLFRHRHYLTFDVLMCAKVQHSFFVAPIKGHGDMQGHPTLLTMACTFDMRLILL